MAPAVAQGRFLKPNGLPSCSPGFAEPWVMHTDDSRKSWNPEWVPYHERPSDSDDGRNPVGVRLGRGGRFIAIPGVALLPAVLRTAMQAGAQPRAA